MDSLIIRSEQPHDIAGIAEVHALAFTHSSAMAEVTLVDVLRHRHGFNPDLSLVAELDGRIVGHALFTPRRIQLGGVMQDAAILSPVGVHPDYQNSGIGARLTKEGHRRLARTGCEFILVLGHPTYYPKFGYQTHMHGLCATVIARADILRSNRQLTERRVQLGDIPQLLEMWKTWFDGVDLGIWPGDSILDWVTPDKSTTTSAVCDEATGSMIGYIRYPSGQPHRLSLFLTVGAEATMSLLAYLNDKIQDADTQDLTLPVHPSSSTAKSFIGVPYTAKIQPWGAGMLYVANPENDAVQRYVDEVKCSVRPIGHVVWPVEFDVCD